jgi:hypothetical protein
VGVHLQQDMTSNSDPPLSDESQDVVEDYEEPRPQDDGPSLPASSSSSSSFNTIFVQHPRWRILSRWWTTVYPSRLTAQHEPRRYPFAGPPPTRRLPSARRPAFSPDFTRAGGATSAAPQPSRRARGSRPHAGTTPWAPGLLVHDLQPRRSAQTTPARRGLSAPAVPSGVLRFVHESQLTVHGQSIPGGFSRRITAYATSAEAGFPT